MIFLPIKVIMQEQKKTQWYIGAPNAVVLCVHRSDRGRLSGELYHSYAQSAAPFENTEQMTRHMERLYDWLDFPRRGTNSRSFAENHPAASRGVGARMSGQERVKIMSDGSLLQKHGDIGTFIVRVQHRQNSSWQGRITWMEEDKTISFRSVWEMIKLIESAVDTVSGQEETGEADWFESPDR